MRRRRRREKAKQRTIVAIANLIAISATIQLFCISFSSRIPRVLPVYAIDLLCLCLEPSISSFYACCLLRNPHISFIMAALSSLPFLSTLSQAHECKCRLPGLTASLMPGFGGSEGLRRRVSLEMEQLVAASVARPLNRQSPRSCLLAVATVVSDVPPVSETKNAFLKAYRKPIPSIYSNIIQELLVLQHLMRYNRTYQYDAVFALGFVTVYDQLMDGYPSDEDREAIFKAYINALREDPDQYRRDTQKLEEWAASQNADSIISFASKEGEVESLLKDIAERAKEKKNFHYSRFFAIGLFRLLELAKGTDPIVLEKLSKALNISKRSVDRDLDVYRNLLSKLAQSKELMKEYIDREKKKQAEREVNSKTDGAAVAKVEVK